MNVGHYGAHYDRVWCVDFEYYPGSSKADAPRPICMVAKEILSGDVVRKWLWTGDKSSPIRFTERDLYVSYYASAEITCHLAFDWPIPPRILDLSAEFRAHFNGVDRHQSESEKAALKKGEKYSLLTAMFAFQLGDVAIQTGRKKNMRALCIRGGPYTSGEQRDILRYCESDVVALEQLIPKMWPHIRDNLKWALFRGRYMAAVAHIERRGVPLDLEMFERLKDTWPAIVARLIERNRDQYDVIGHKDIDREKFRQWLLHLGLLEGWPTTASGVLSTNRDVLSDWAKYSPDVMGLKEFLMAVRSTRLFETLLVGSDGRNRCLLSPFGSKTGRNTPSNAKSVFGPARWVRSLIKPPERTALVYGDWSGQEYGIAAYFSNDADMIHDYVNDDPYLGFAKRIGLAPADATKKSHKTLRSQLKVAAGLGVLYGAGPETVARAGGMTESMATYVLREHRYAYPIFWDWRQQIIDHGRLDSRYRTNLGWTWRANDDDPDTSLSNWMMQSHGADMMRVACCLAVERRLEVCMPVHDALLVQCPIESVEQTKTMLAEVMREASSAVLMGPELKVGFDPMVAYPNRYKADGGEKMWSNVTEIEAELRNAKCSVPNV